MAVIKLHRNKRLTIYCPHCNRKADHQEAELVAHPHLAVDAINPPVYISFLDR